MRGILQRLRAARSGAAAVEFAMIAPVFVLIGFGLVDLGYAFHVRLCLANATTAGALYAQVNGQNLTASDLPDYVGKVQAVVTAAATGLPQAPTVSVLFNDAADAGRVGTFYCLSAAPVTWTSTGAAAASCGGNVMSGKFVTISVTANRPTLFFRLGTGTAFSALVQTSDFAMARVQ